MAYIYCFFLSILIAGTSSLTATEPLKEKNKFKQVFYKILSYKPQKLFKKFGKRKKVLIHPQNWQENLLHAPLAESRKQKKKSSLRSYKISSSDSFSEETEQHFQNFCKDLKKEDEKDPFASIEEQIFLAQKILEEEKAFLKTSDGPRAYLFQEHTENLPQMDEDNDSFSSTLGEKEQQSPIQISPHNKVWDDFNSVTTSSENSVETTEEESSSENFSYSSVNFSENMKEDLEISSSFGSKKRRKEKPSQVLYKSRLFLGEADFSYTLALLKKHAFQHPNLAQAIVATELRSEQNLRTLYAPSFTRNVQQLEQQGVKVLYGIDATQIAQRFSERYARIHFNFPHNRCPPNDRSLSRLIKKFFLSASQIQNKQDRIHITIPQMRDDQENLFKQAYVYGLYDASYAAGYEYWKKRRFDPERYPGYRHRITGQNKSARMSREGREYIFIKVSTLRFLQKSSVQKQVKGKKCVRGFYNCLPDQDTDSESTSYEDHSRGRWTCPLKEKKGIFKY